MQDNCIFCKIAKKEIPAQVVYEDNLMMAFQDITPAAPVHVLLIPKEHVASVLEIEDKTDLISHMMTRIPQIARQLEIDEQGFRIVMNTKEWGGQTVHHLHIHLLGGRAMSWPPG